MRLDGNSYTRRPIICRIHFSFLPILFANFSSVHLFVCSSVCLQMKMRTSERTRARALATLHYTVVKFVVVRHTHT